MRKMRSILLALLLLQFCATTLLGEHPCRCGSFATGIYSYYVSGYNCCTDAVQNYGSYSTYILQDNGVWQLDTVTVISSGAAQGSCCNR